MAKTEAALSKENLSADMEPVVTSQDHSSIDEGLDKAFDAMGGEENDPDNKPDKIETPDVKVDTKPAVTTPPKTGDLTKKDEPVIEPPAEVQKPDSTLPVKEEPLSEIDKIKKPDNLSPKASANWDKFREVSKKIEVESKQKESALKERDSVITELKAQIDHLSSRPIPDEFKKEYEELKTFRSMHDMENSPEFKSKYDARLASTSDEIHQFFRRFQMKEDLVKEIESGGGIFNKVNDQGEKILQTEWFEQVLQSLPYADRKELELMVQDGIKLNRDRGIELQNMHKTRGEWEAKQKQEVTQRFQTDTNHIAQAIDQIRPAIPEANRKEIPKDATPEQRKAIETHNQLVDTVEQVFDNALYPKDAQTRAEVAMAAAGAIIFENRLNTALSQIEVKDREIASLKESYNKLKGAGKTSNQGLAAPRTETKTNPSDRVHMNSEDAIEAGLKDEGV